MFTFPCSFRLRVRFRLRLHFRVRLRFHFCLHAQFRYRVRFRFSLGVRFRLRLDVVSVFVYDLMFIAFHACVFVFAYVQFSRHTLFEFPPKKEGGIKSTSQVPVQYFKQFGFSFPFADFHF